MTLKQFNEARDKALMSLNEERIREFYSTAYNRSMPSNPVVFWGSVHKAITGNTALPIELRRKSKAWLTQHGFMSWDDGDV